MRARRLLSNLLLVLLFSLLVIFGDGTLRPHHTAYPAGAMLPPPDRQQAPAAPAQPVKPAQPAPALAATAPTPPAPAPRRDLGAFLQAWGIDLPEGSNVYAAVSRPDPEGLGLEEYEAGGGATATAFWPASSVKPLAAVGALEFLGGYGFTGAATVSIDGEEGAWTVEDLYGEAITDSSNDAYDLLVQIAGVDWLNTTFLTPDHGFHQTVIQRSYVNGGGLPSPPMTISEGGRSVDVPKRDAGGNPAVPDDGNRSDLGELAQSVARVVLHDQLPPERRFPIGGADAIALRYALLAADGFLAPGIHDALGPDALVYSKPGYVVGDDCVDVAYVQEPGSDTGYLLGVSTPDDKQDCATLVGIAEASMVFVRSSGMPLP